MRRILVIGCCGAGKSTLARSLGERLDLPVHHLDRLFWLPSWEERDREAFKRDQEEIFEEPAWIIDGNYGSTLEIRLTACDTAIYLDLPLPICFWRVLKRSIARAPRPDMAKGCIERIDWEFYRYVLTFRRTQRPRTEKLLAEANHFTLHRLQTPKQVRKFLSSL